MLTKALIDKLFHLYQNPRVTSCEQFTTKAAHEYNVPADQARILWFAWDTAEGYTTTMLGDLLKDGVPHGN